MRWGNWDAHNAAVLECTAASTPIAACAANERGNGAPTYPGLASPSTTFPDSFYYSGRPSWWSGSIPFPAIGPDISSGNVGICSGTINTAGHYSGVAATSGTQCTGTTLITAWAGQVNAIPAMDCYLNTLNGPPDGSGGILPFDAANCYTSTPAVTLTVTKTGTGTGNYHRHQLHHRKLHQRYKHRHLHGDGKRRVTSHFSHRDGRRMLLRLYLPPPSRSPPTRPSPRASWGRSRLRPSAPPRSHRRGS